MGHAPVELPRSLKRRAAFRYSGKFFMNPDQILSVGFYGLVCVFACIFRYQRWRWLRRGRQGFYPRGAALGNALQQLQVIAEPQTKYVIEEKLDEEVDADDEGGPDDPVRHLHRQAAKIRRGERLDQLTTFLPKRE
jgi:hypothetical protein